MDHRAGGKYWQRLLSHFKLDVSRGALAKHANGPIHNERTLLLAYLYKIVTKQIALASQLRG